MLKIVTPFALLCLLLSACGTVTVQTPLANCSRLIPAEWREGVPGSPVPPPVASTVTDPLERARTGERAWAGAYVSQTGQLDKANGHTAAVIHIFTTCEAMVNEARADQ